MDSDKTAPVGVRIETAPRELFGRRYELREQLGQGGMGVVYRAYDRLTGRFVALKQVTTNPDHLVFASKTNQAEASGKMDFRLALANEFKTLASLRHPNIISVLDYGFDSRGQPFFTMDLLEDAKTILVAGRGRSVATRLRLLIQVLYALAYLHRRGILHRDLKPGNVLVADGQVKVLDFGLAIARGEQTEHSAGTLGYMAPELLKGEPSSEASDMYAVGVIGYEMLTGRYPFEAKDSSSILDQIMNTPVTFGAASEIDPRVVTVIERLLAKAPEDRYPDVNTVIALYAAANNQQIPYETSATRESFLQAAQFVGRTAEMAQLTGALSGALAGHGGLWLIGGESGVGKSRLADELRTVGLVQGMQAIRGQAVSEGGSSYQVWRDLLRRLALLVDLNDAEASVLKAVIPGLANLLGRVIPDAPELEPQPTQVRLLTTLQDLVGRTTQPMLVILEDLQWAGEESLTLLEWLARAAADRRILLIGTFRDDEKPDLPARFSAAHTFKLHRLPRETIAELSAYILGGDQQPALIDLLERETAGNVFFLIEVIRALAEDAGRLDQVAGANLPAAVFTGGMRRILERRLAHLPDPARALLNAAAAAGRQLDLPALAQIDAQIVLDRWLDQGASAAILEVHDLGWRFAHDKMREVLLEALSTDQKSTVHRQVARAIEAAHPDQAGYAPALAYHWSVAGDADKELTYSALAAQQALRSGAFQDALGYLERALALLHESGKPLRTLEADLERQLGECYYALGQQPISRTHFLRALTLLDAPSALPGVGLWVSITRQVAIQVLHRLRAGRVVVRDETRRGRLRDATRIYQQLAQMYVLSSEKFPALNAALCALNLAEQVGPSPELARAYATISAAGGLVPLHGLAHAYGQRATQTAEQANDPTATAWVLEVVAYYYSGIGDWDTAESLLQRAIQLNEQLGNWRQWDEANGMMRSLMSLRGRFGEAERNYASFLLPTSRSAQRGDQQMQLMPWLNQQHCLRIRQDMPRAQTIVERLAPTLAGFSRTEQAWGYGQFAAVWLDAGQWAQARASADQSARAIAEATSTAYYALEGYSGLAEARLGLWRTFPDQEAYRHDAREACAALRKYARIFPIAQSRAALWSGLYDWQSGQHERALAAWRQSIQAAQRLKMPYDEALAQHFLGQHLPAADPSRQVYLTAAQTLYEQVGARYYLGQVQALLGDESEKG